MTWAELIAHTPLRDLDRREEWEFFFPCRRCGITLDSRRIDGRTRGWRREFCPACRRIARDYTEDRRIVLPFHFFHGADPTAEIAIANVLRERGY